MKLFYKILLSFVLTFLVVVVLFGVAMRQAVYRDFADYVNRAELSRLDGLVEALAGEYDRDQGWSGLQKRPWRWTRIINQGLRPESRGGTERPGPPPPPPEAGDRPAPRHPVDPLQLGARLSLFDREGNYVIGQHDPSAPYTLRPIEVDGRRVGSLGLALVQGMYHPLDLEFLAGQTRAMIFLGVGLAVLVTLVSWILARRLTDPLRKLTAGARALASRDLDVRVEVRSRDELGRLAEDFNRMAADLKQYELMRRQWISDIAHELRNPLTVLRGRVEAVEDGVRPLDRETFDGIARDVTRLGRLVEDLRLLSQADSGTLGLKRDPVSLLDPLEAAVESFQPLFAQNGLEIELDLSGLPGVVLTGDEDRLTQVFSNLLGNSFRYTDSPGRVVVSGKKRGTEAAALVFEDTAPGVPDEDLERIFDRLYRVEKSRSRALGGSGLGLSICRRLLQAHGGRISASKSSLGGLRIELELPLAGVKQLSNETVKRG